MRRNDRQITDRVRIDEIIRRCNVCHLAMCENDNPYVVPLNYGYDGQYLYFHSATTGKKLDILKRNNRVSFEFDQLHSITTSERACDWGANYESVIGYGIAEILETINDKQCALAAIMRQYRGSEANISEKELRKVSVIRVQITEVTGKSRQHKVSANQLL